MILRNLLFFLFLLSLMFSDNIKLTKKYTFEKVQLLMIFILQIKLDDPTLGDHLKRIEILHLKEKFKQGMIVIYF